MSQIIYKWFSVMILTLVSLGIFAEVTVESKNLEALSKIAIAKAQATSGTPPTIELVMQKVRKAAKLLEKEGPAAFPKFRGNSDFIFNGTYIYIVEMDIKMLLVHPMQPKMENTNVSTSRDAKGIFFFIEAENLMLESPTGEIWFEYFWPRPGQTEASPKIAFFKKAVFKGRVFVVSCGAYDMDISNIDVKKLSNNK